MYFCQITVNFKNLTAPFINFKAFSFIININLKIVLATLALIRIVMYFGQITVNSVPFIKVIIN